MRITQHLKRKILSVRLELVSNLRQTTINYVLQATQDTNIGIRQDRRDFLAVQPQPGVKLSKVIYRAKLARIYY